ncbi:glycosyltransferase BC10-like [Eucalyptus grandis]|uniref:glycosyltransferase BC10-like n=1 Tax=Eucalyptus grandis TaxID=71139 RepID=UPI00192F0FB9|nr:glycosyltransferase BC10-like [Eucalyptus grandis]
MSCVPLHTFYLMHTNISYVDCFLDPGRYGNGRYSKQMLPEVKKINFRKGAQWFTMKRQHALILVADSLYYSKFRDHSQPGLDGKGCIADEHYIPTFLNVSILICVTTSSIDVSIHETSDNKRLRTYCRKVSELLPFVLLQCLLEFFVAILLDWRSLQLRYIQLLQ